MCAIKSFSDSWDLFPRTFGSSDCTVRFDYGALHLSSAERAGFPHTMVVHVPFVEMREGGLPTNTELTRIYALEDAFSLRDDSLRHIGVLTGNGAASFVFCRKGKSEELEKLGHEMMSPLKTQYTLHILSDDNFGYFDKMLAPSLYDMNWMSSRRVCDMLQEQGDALTAPREIDFSIEFQNESDIDGVAAKLVEQGFSVRSRVQDEDGFFSLELTLEAVPTLDNITEITEGIISLLDGVDATFDGWGCEIVKE